MKRITNLHIGLALLAIVLGFYWATRERGATELTAAHRDAVALVHREHGWPPPSSLSMSDDVVVATYEVTGPTVAPRAMAEERLLAIREELLPHGFRHFRVSINAPAPPGQVSRYGTARWMYGGSLTWSRP